MFIPLLNRLLKAKNLVFVFNTFQYFSFSISKKTSGKETSAIAWLISNLIGFYCARLVYFARVL